MKVTGVTGYMINKEIGVSKSTISNYLDGKTTPTGSKLNQLLDYFSAKGISKDYLLTGKEPVFNTLDSSISENKNGNKFIKLSDGTYDIEVSHIPFTAYASYLDSLETGTVNQDFESSVFNVDQFGRGKYMSFTVKGDSMNGGSIDDTPDGAKVLGRELGKHHWRDGFKPTKYGWVILSTHNIFHKDIIDFEPETGCIKCHSRNKSPEYSDFELSLNDVYSIYKVIKRIF